MFNRLIKKTYAINVLHKHRVKSWAYKLGFELSQLGKYVTGVPEVQDSYKQAEVKPRDGNALVQEIAKDVGFMMASKISAVKVSQISDDP